MYACILAGEALESSRKEACQGVRSCLQSGQPLQRKMKGLVFFGKTKTHYALVESIAVKRRQRDGGHAYLARQPLAEVRLTELADF
jgi:hypothetical protein